MHIYTFVLCVCVCICKLGMSSFWCLTTLIHSHLNHSSYLPLFICKLLLQKWEPRIPPSAIPWLNLSFPVYMYSDFRIVKPYTYGDNFITTVRYLYAGLLPSVSQTPLMSKVAEVSTHFPQPPSERLFHTFVIQLDCFVIVYSMWDPLTC